jgi:hypothetical protein
MVEQLAQEGRPQLSRCTPTAAMTMRHATVPRSACDPDNPLSCPALPPLNDLEEPLQMCLCLRVIQIGWWSGQISFSPLEFVNCHDRYIIKCHGLFGGSNGK